MAVLNTHTGGLTIPPAQSLAAVAGPRRLAGAGARATVPVTYGTDRVPALILNVLMSGTPGFLLVQCLWGHACSAISEVRWNDQALPAGVTVTHYTGAQTTADPALATALAAAGVTAEALTGYAYSVVSMPVRLFDGQLQFSAQIVGRAVYDPRKDSTAGGSGSHRLASPATWEPSDNPSLALADWLTNTTFGAGEPVDWSSVPAAANANDSTVTGTGGTEKRRTLGLTLSQPAGMKQVSDALRAYAGCWLVPTAAGLKLLPDADDAAVASYDHAAGQIAALDGLALRDLGNVPTAVEVVYTDTSQIPWRTASAIASVPGAGSTKPWRLSVVQMPGVQRYSQAMREATERLNKLQLGDLASSIEVFDIGIRHEVGDIITVTHPLGLVSKPLRVTDVLMPGPGRWRLGISEHDPAAYSSTVQTRATVPDTPRILSIAGDDVLSAGDKSEAILKWSVISGERAGIEAQATAYGLPALKAAYSSAVDALDAYLASLTPAWNDTTQDTPIVGATFRAKFSDVYLARQALQDAIPGSAAGGLVLRQSSLTFLYPKTGGVTPASITMLAERKGAIAGTISWSVVSGTATLSGSGDARTLAAADLTTASATIRAEITDGSGVTYRAETTVSKVVDGADGAAGTPGAPGTDGVDGVDGADGKMVEFIWKRATSQPATPSGGGIPSGWSDEPPAGADPLWMSRAKQELDGSLVAGESWSTPIRHDGPPGADGADAPWVVVTGDNQNANDAGHVGRGIALSTGFANGGGTRGHTLWTLNPATGAIVSGHSTYDTWGSGAAITALVSALSAVGSDLVVALYSCDATSCDAAMRAELAALGSGRSETWAGARTSHVFIGQRGLLPGQAYEAISSASDASGVVSVQAYFTASGLVRNGAKGADGADGVDGIDGTDGKLVEFVWKRAASAPATPTGNGIPSGWSDDPPAGSDPLWMSKAKQELDGTLVFGGSWSTPIRHDGPPGTPGADGADGSDGAPGAPGTPAVSATLSLSAINLPAYSDGVVTSYSGAVTLMTVMLGTTDDSANWSFSNSPSTGLTISAGGSPSGRQITVTAMSSSVDSGYVDITATRSGYPTQTLRLAVGKNKAATPSAGPVASPGNFFIDDVATSPADATASIEFRRNGQIWYYTSADSGHCGDWYKGGSSTVGDGYEVRLDLLTTSGLSGGVSGMTVATWTAINADRALTVATPENGIAQRRRTYSYTIERVSPREPACSGVVALDAGVDS